MATNSETTTDKILHHIKKGWPITKMDAMKLFGTTALNDIVFRLRKKHIIDTVMVKNKNGNGEHAQYIYKGERGREPETEGYTKGYQGEFK